MPQVLVLDDTAAIGISAAALPRQSPVSQSLAEVHFGRLPLAIADGPPRGSGDPAEMPGGALSLGRFEVDQDVLALLRGIDQLLQWDVDVISLSLGPAHRVLAPQHPLATAVRFAWDSGVVVVVAAGNWGPEPDSLQALARLPQVIAVGATDDDAGLLASSSRGTPQGPQPTVVASGMTPSRPGVPDFDPGTSFAAPKVAGLSAAVLRALQLLRQDFADQLHGEWSNLTSPVKRPIIGVLDTGVDPAALQGSEAEQAGWRGGGLIRLSRGERDRAWVAGLNAELARLGISCLFSVTPGTVRDALRQAARPLPGRLRWEVGAGLLDETQVHAWLSSLTPSRFVKLFATRAPSPSQREGLAELDLSLGPRWDTVVASLYLSLFRQGASLAVVRVV